MLCFSTPFLRSSYSASRRAVRIVLYVSRDTVQLTSSLSCSGWWDRTAKEDRVELRTVKLQACIRACVHLLFTAISLIRKSHFSIKCAVQVPIATEVSLLSYLCGERHRSSPVSLWSISFGLTCVCRVPLHQRIIVLGLACLR